MDSDEEDLFVRQEDENYEKQSLIEAVRNEANGTNFQGYTYDGNDLNKKDEQPPLERNRFIHKQVVTIVQPESVESDSATLRDDIYNRTGEELYNSVILSTPLQFQKTIIRDMLSEDALLILGKGLGIHLIAANLLHALDVAGSVRSGTSDANDAKSSLVLLVGANDFEIQRISEELWYLSQLADPSVICHRGLTIVKNETTTISQREDLYKQGGVFSVRYQALIADILSEVIDCRKVTGIVAFDSDRRVDRHYLEWVIRRYRLKNSKGFIKALSENAESFGSGFTSGIQPLQTKLKSLALKRVLLWPRFHIEVAESLLLSRKHNNSIIEIEIEKSESMRRMQTAIMDSIETCISRIKRATSSIKVISSEDWNLDNALLMKLARQVRSELSPYWHLISYDARQLVGDLSTLQELLDDMLSLDSIGFLRRLLDISNSATKNVATHGVSDWLMDDSGSLLFQLAKERIANKKSEIFEELPKWYHLDRILEEIAIEKSSTNPDDTGGPILIMCNERRVARQLRSYIDKISTVKRKMRNSEEEEISPGQVYMKERFQQYIEHQKFIRKKQQIQAKLVNTENKEVQNGNTDHNTAASSTTTTVPSPSRSKRRRVRGGLSTSAISRSDRPSTSSIPEIEEQIVEIDLTDNNDDDQFDDSIIKLISEENEQIDDLTFLSESITNLQIIDNGQLILIEQYDKFKDDSRLEELMPSYIIMYEPNTPFFRRIEVLRASHIDKQIKAYLMFYKESVEEQKFITEIRRERDAFTKLIREKANMAIHLETQEDIQARLTNNSDLLRTVSSRIAGGGLLGFNNEKPRIVVDNRELKAPLPAVLDRNNVEVIPMTLTVGDYILSPKICIERKSVSDFIQSLTNGRLHEQCTAMCRYYEYPAVLIEFDDLDSFSFNTVEGVPQLRSRSFADVDRFITENDRLRTQITLLILHHPQLRLLWSPSPSDSAEIFSLLKKGGQEPDPEICAKIGGQNVGDYNNSAIDTLLAMPGITTNNYNLIIHKVPNIQTLFSMPEKEIADIIGNEAAGKLVRFFNQSI